MIAVVMWIFTPLPRLKKTLKPEKKRKEFTSRLLQAGMVLTLEPGIYVRTAKDVPERFHNIGIRIEDDALVTNDGSELLTREVPVLPYEIEKLMQGAL